MPVIAWGIVRERSEMPIGALVAVFVCVFVALYVVLLIRRRR